MDSPEAVGPTSTVGMVAAAALHLGAVSIQGKLGNETVEMMLDSGSSVSLLCEDVLKQLPQYCSITLRRLQLVSAAAGKHIPVVDRVSIWVNFSDRQIKEPFVVVGALIVRVILGLDFQCKSRLILDFPTCPIKILSWPL